MIIYLDTNRGGFYDRDTLSVSKFTEKVRVAQNNCGDLNIVNTSVLIPVLHEDYVYTINFTSRVQASTV